MNEKIKALIEQRNKCVNDIRAVLDAAEKESKGVLTGDQDQKVKDLEAEVERISGRVDLETRQYNREKTVLAGSEPVIVGAGSQDSGSKDEQLRSKFFEAWIRRGPAAASMPEFRNLNAGDVAQGGSFIAPPTFVTEVLKAVDDAVKVRQLARVIQLTNSQSLGIPTLDADLDDFEWTTELLTGSLDTAMRTGKREMVPNPFAKRVKMSKKLMQISAVPVVEFLKQRLAYKVGVTAEKAFMTGTGVGRPLGLYVASENGIPTSRDVSTGNTDTEPRFDGLIEGLYSLKEQYRNNATFLFHRTALKLLRKIKDGEGQYIWQAAVTAGQPDSILGRPVVDSENNPSTFTTGQYFGIVGDFKYYWIVDVLNMEIQQLNELYAETNQVGWITRVEMDGAPVMPEAFARLKLA